VSNVLGASEAAVAVAQDAQRRSDAIAARAAAAARNKKTIAQQILAVSESRIQAGFGRGGRVQGEKVAAAAATAAAAAAAAAGTTYLLWRATGTEAYHVALSYRAFSGAQQEDGRAADPRGEQCKTPACAGSCVGSRTTPSGPLPRLPDSLDTPPKPPGPGESLSLLPTHHPSPNTNKERALSCPFIY
jgi:hypothetical protein